MAGYLVRQLTAGGSYLEHRPAVDAFEWLAPSPTYATVFSKAVAESIAAALRGRGDAAVAVPDTAYQRDPDISELPAQFRQAA